VDIESQVSHIADLDRVTYREEPTDYFPGVKDATPSRLNPGVREQINPVSSFGQREEAEMSPSDAGSKRQRLDDG
jgi:hypothetical protein